MRYLLLFISLFLLLSGVASAYATVHVSVNSPKLFGLFSTYEVQYGKYIEVWVRVSNVGSGIIKVTKVVLDITTPHGKHIVKSYSMDYMIPPNDHKDIGIKTGVVANELGVWKVKATVYMDNYVLGSDYTEFKVVPSTSNVHVINIVGYIAVASAIIGGAIYATRR